jgi:hypothetical protein
MRDLVVLFLHLATVARLAGPGAHTAARADLNNVR